MLLEIRDGTVRQGGEIVLSHFSFEIRGTEKAALVGRNGAGKTTLLQVLTGEIDLDRNEKNPSSGMCRARKYSVGVFRQQMEEDPRMSVAEYEEQCAGKCLGGTGLSSPEYDFHIRFDRLFTQLGFVREDKEKRLGQFSGGQQVKIRLIGLLLTAPDILILDEPTNHLDLAATAWLEHCVRTYPKAVVEVSHDRYFIDETADVIWEVTGGRIDRYSGNYTDYRREKALRYQQQMKQWETQQAEIQRLNGLIEQFKHKPRKAAFARSRRTMLERMERVPKPVADDAVIHTGDIVPERPGSKLVYECEHLLIGYDAGLPLQEISLRLRRGTKLGVLGANGTGKSTFLKTVAGLLPPLKGSQHTGVHIDAAYFDQNTAQITSEECVMDWFHDRFPALTMKEVRTALAGYLFRSQDLGKPVKSLSGGEKTRLVLAAMLQGRPNFLILDEPTNNMDIPAKETLESVFRSYKGTILFVSHDRYFLSTVAQSLLIFEKEAILYYPFGYRHYQEHKDRAGRGEDPAAARTLEEQRLIEGLKAVPKQDAHPLRQVSYREASQEWEMEQALREMDGAERRYEQTWKAKEEVDERALEVFARTEGLAETDQTAGEYLNDPEMLSEAETAWTKACLKWYEAWKDTDEGQRRTPEEADDDHK